MDFRQIRLQISKTNKINKHDKNKMLTFWVTTVLYQERILFKDALQRYLSIPSDSRVKVRLYQPGKLKGLVRRMWEISKELKTDSDVRLFLDEPEVELKFSHDNRARKKFSQLKTFERYHQKFLVAFPIGKGEVSGDAVILPSYLPISVRVASGLVNVEQKHFSKFKEEMVKIIQDFDVGPHTLPDGILLLDNPPTSDSQYEYIEPSAIVLNDWPPTVPPRPKSMEPKSQKPAVPAPFTGDDGVVGKISNVRNHVFNELKNKFRQVRKPTEKTAVVQPMSPQPRSPQYENSSAQSFHAAKKPPIIAQKPLQSVTTESKLFPSKSDGTERITFPLQPTNGKASADQDPVYCIPPPPRPINDTTDIYSTCTTNSVSLQNIDPKASAEYSQEPYRQFIQQDISLDGTSDEDYEDYCIPPPPRPIDNATELIDTPKQNAVSSQEKSSDVDSRPDISKLSVNEVGYWLKKLNLGEYESLMAADQVDGALLNELDEDMMVDHFKMSRFKAKKLVLFCRHGWLPKEESNVIK
ncbi:hypothetical protein CAPTEDRAFT_194236 [Capitella teleta]|uniref:SAM domain-containing protein n=1 Tax=Capitella teleta TaxID=283909 RepID=R7TES3_CAPTE|nr:hypothetical protein CAPTEDRAFT_194236 [Capitella teleta]|eukprot:ELT92229.1 hypothetical protein CAPTEDRAFT_194236 [Capitella teleta]